MAYLVLMHPDSAPYGGFSDLDRWKPERKYRLTEKTPQIIPYYAPVFIEDRKYGRDSAFLRLITVVVAIAALIFFLLTAFFSISLIIPAVLLSSVAASGLSIIATREWRK